MRSAAACSAASCRACAAASAYTNRSPASISTRSWMSSMAVTRSRSVPGGAYSRSTSAISARCQECSAEFSFLVPSRMLLCLEHPLQLVGFAQETGLASAGTLARSPAGAPRGTAADSMALFDQEPPGTVAPDPAR